MNVATLAENQSGVISRHQLLAVGRSDEFIENQLLAGRWQRVHRGVYATFTGPLPFAARVSAALLGVGEGAAASHETAAYLDRLADEPGEVIHVTVPTCRRVTGRMQGVIVHYAARLPMSRHPVRIPPRTRIEDTVLDLIDGARSVDEVATWVTRASDG